MPSRFSSDHSRTDADDAGRRRRHRPAHHRHRGGPRGLPRPARPELRGPARGPGRGEPPAPHPRHPADGALEQAPGLAGAHHRQQERAGRRLLHALRRHRRRASPSSRTSRSSSSTSCAGYRNERAGRELVPESVLTKPPSAELRPGPARRPVAAALRGPRPAPRGLRGGRPHPRRARRGRASTRRWSSASPASWTSPSTSAGRTRPGPRLTPKAFGKDRRMPITNGYRG